ncbi:hypothetical protein X975_25934, partial [Stegodyphus mimosarum]
MADFSSHASIDYSQYRFARPMGHFQCQAVIFFTLEKELRHRETHSETFTWLMRKY